MPFSLGRPALGRVLVVPNFFHFWMMEATVLSGTFNATEIVPVPQYNPVSEVYIQFLGLHVLICALTCSLLLNFGPYIDRCVHFQVDSNQVVETSQG